MKSRNFGHFWLPLPQHRAFNYCGLSTVVTKSLTPSPLRRWRQLSTTPQSKQRVVWNNFSKTSFCVQWFVIIISPCYKFSCQCTTAISFIFGLTGPRWAQHGNIYHSPTCKHMLNTYILILHIYIYRQKVGIFQRLLTSFSWSKHLHFVNITKV